MAWDLTKRRGRRVGRHTKLLAPAICFGTLCVTISLTSLLRADQNDVLAPMPQQTMPMPVAVASPPKISPAATPNNLTLSSPYSTSGQVRTVSAVYSAVSSPAPAAFEGNLPPAVGTPSAPQRPSHGETKLRGGHSVELRQISVLPEFQQSPSELEQPFQPHQFPIAGNHRPPMPTNGQHVPNQQGQVLAIPPQPLRIAQTDGQYSDTRVAQPAVSRDGTLSGHSMRVAEDGTRIVSDSSTELHPQLFPSPADNASDRPSPADSVSDHDDSDPLWWEARLSESILKNRLPLSFSVQRALGLALSEAPELQVLQSDWYIQQAEAKRQSAAFDWTTFVDSVWNRDSTPVGSDLDGSAQRLRQRGLNAGGGVRRLTRSGAELEVSQNFGTLNSNSRFINPNNQATSRLALQYERPLLQGAGEDYNTSRIQLAEISKETAFDRFQMGIQDHLLDVASAYWTLVLRRGQFLQAVNSWNRAKEITAEMESRVDIDVTPGMLERTKSELAMRLSTAIEAEHDIIRSQDSLLRLIYGSRFTDFADQEILTTSLPMRQAHAVQPHEHVDHAIRERSEVHQAIREIKAASVRYDVATNEILPVLNMVLTGYVAGLRGNNDVGGSFFNQFSEGEPGVGIGFNFEIPYRNRAAHAAAEQGMVAIKRMQAQFEATVGIVAEDVRSQVIQRNKFGTVLTQQREALERSQKILEYAQTRRELLADGVDVADLYLENLLQMQGRLADAEFTYLQTQVRYTLADNALSRAVSSLDRIAESTTATSATVEQERQFTVGHSFAEERRPTRDFDRTVDAE